MFIYEALDLRSQEHGMGGRRYFKCSYLHTRLSGEIASATLSILKAGDKRPGKK